MTSAFVLGALEFRLLSQTGLSREHKTFVVIRRLETRNNVAPPTDTPTTARRPVTEPQVNESLSGIKIITQRL